MKMSVCITLKNRAELLRGKLDELLHQTFPAKNVEVCITDGGSNDGLVDMLKQYAPKFNRVTYAISDRDALPFKIPFNNPACDINAQICNVASFDVVVRTDAEVRFRRNDTMAMIAEAMEKDPHVGIAFTCYRMDASYVVGSDDWEKHVTRTSNDGFFCVCFRKSDFIKRGGVDERFALGFAAEDSHFCWWWRTHDWMSKSPKDHRVMHLDHGEVAVPPAKRLWHEYTMPLYRMLKHHRVRPNTGNPFWKRPEMIKDKQTWQA